MRFLSVLWAISRNTAQEIFRQPIYGILIFSGMALIALSPTVAMFTMMEDVKLVIDMGLATIFLLGIGLAVFAASRVINREIEAKTVATVMSKPVGRFTFLLGKFGGLALALLAAQYLLSVMLILTIRMGVPETASFKIDWPVLLGQLFPALFALLMGAYKNYFYKAPFTSSAVAAALPLYTIALMFLCIAGPGWRYDWFAKTFIGVKGIQVSKACLILFFGITVMLGIALVAATRVGIVSNIIICGSVFFLGMVSYHLFGQFAADNIFARIAYAVVPNLQTFWISEGLLNVTPVVPWRYVRMAFSYSVCFNMALLALAAFFFEERELV